MTFEKKKTEEKSLQRTILQTLFSVGTIGVDKILFIDPKPIDYHSSTVPSTFGPKEQFHFGRLTLLSKSKLIVVNGINHLTKAITNNYSVHLFLL